MDSFSVLVGGKAGDGIAEAGRMIAQVLNRLGYFLYQHVDSPSLIRGGHNFVTVRAARQQISAPRDEVVALVALTAETIAKHEWRLERDGVILYDSGAVEEAALVAAAGRTAVGLPLRRILEEAGGLPVMRNSIILGALCRALSVPWSVVEATIVTHQAKATELNLALAHRGYELGREVLPTPDLSAAPRPLIAGLQAMGLGLVRGGLQAYLGYPMTPTSGLLHFLAEEAPRFALKVYQPEGEIGVMLMALGHAYAGERVAVGTSGGGFALMIEGLSLAAQTELPIVVVLGQRTGPSTGLPTYTGQAELDFAISAGHGEFPRAVIAPADAEQALAWSTLALDLAWRYQTPVIMLGDRTLNDNSQSLCLEAVPRLPRLTQVDWDGVPMDPSPDMAYKRYRFTHDGVSPLAVPGRRGALVKANSYTHDEFGITTEDPALTAQMQEKWLRKGRALAQTLDELPQVNVYGEPQAPRAVVCWGSPTGALREIGAAAGLRIVQPAVLWPFPTRQLTAALAGAERVAVAEVNAGGQLANLMACRGLRVDTRINRYDGRPWAVGELRQRVEEVLS